MTHLPLDVRFKVTAYYQQHQERLQKLKDVEIQDELHKEFGHRLSGGQICSVRRSLGIQKMGGRKKKDDQQLLVGIEISELRLAIKSLTARVAILEQKGGAA